MEELSLINSLFEDSKAKQGIKHVFEAQQGNEYKYEVCRNWLQGSCTIGRHCIFAHGMHDLAARPFRLDHFKLCYHAHGHSTCNYGNRCQYLHDEMCWNVKQFKILYSKDTKEWYFIKKSEQQDTVMCVKIVETPPGKDKDFDKIRDLLDAIKDCKLYSRKGKKKMKNRSKASRKAFTKYKRFMKLLTPMNPMDVPKSWKVKRFSKKCKQYAKKQRHGRMQKEHNQWGQTSPEVKDFDVTAKSEASSRCSQSPEGCTDDDSQNLSKSSERGDSYQYSAMQNQFARSPQDAARNMGATKKKSNQVGKSLHGSAKRAFEEYASISLTSQQTGTEPSLIDQIPDFSLHLGHKHQPECRCTSPDLPNTHYDQLSSYFQDHFSVEDDVAFDLYYDDYEMLFEPYTRYESLDDFCIPQDMYSTPFLNEFNLPSTYH